MSVALATPPTAAPSTDDRVTLTAALDYLESGLSIVPVKTDGTKTPAVQSWKQFQSRRPTKEEILFWFDRDHPPGIGVLNGNISGHVETLDFDHDGEVIFPQWKELVEAESPGLVDRLCVVRTPRPGFHVRYRCTEISIPGNQKLAMTADAKAETLIETRGEGGYAVAPGSPARVHAAQRPYVHVEGPELLQLQTISAAEREILFQCAALFDRAVAPDLPANRTAGGSEVSPGDAYSADGPDWEEILVDWQLVRVIAEKRYWARPGKDTPGISATTGVCSNSKGHDLLCVFSSNAHPFPGPSAGRACSTHTKFAALALLKFGGDFGAAAKSLVKQGFNGNGHGRNEQVKKSTRTAGATPSGKGRVSQSRILADACDDIRRRTGGEIAAILNPVPCPDVPGARIFSWRLTDGRIESRRIERRPDDLYYLVNPSMEATTSAVPATAGTSDAAADTSADVLTPNEAPDDNHRLARLFLSEKCHHADGLTLQTYQDERQLWNGSVYRQFPERELHAAINASAKAEMDRVNVIEQQTCQPDQPPPKVRQITGKKVADVIHAVTSMTIQPSRVLQPSWIGCQGEFPAAEIIAAPNMLVHVPSFSAGKKYSLPPTPRFFSQNCLDFDFDENAGRPLAWLAFLDELFPNDPQSIATLQMWIGLCLLPDTSFQKILMVIGPKRSGKGTISRVINRLIGENNCVSPTLAGLSGNFGLQPLIGKTLAIIQDARISGRSDVAAVVERLLSISGEDFTTIDRKFLPPATVKLPTRFMIISNELPRLPDSSGALVGRLVVLRLTRSWFGNEDRSLSSRLLAERPGILLWALEGWRRLQEQGRFIQPDSSKSMLEEMDDLSSPISAFIRDCCVVGPDYEIERSVFFDRWKTWCHDQGKEHSGDRATFGRNLHAAVPTITDAQQRTGYGRVWMYRGIGLS